jgi:hypothetical protein
MENQSDYYSFKVAVITSTKKDAYAAGKEVAVKTLEKLGCNPDLFLLFATEHYADNGGFGEFLKGIWEELPDNTPLAGGSVLSFLTNQGCYAQGAVGLAINYPNMNVTIGYGKNTKRNYKKAAKNCLKMIKPNIKNSYKNKILISFISSTKPAKIPSVKDNNFIGSKLLAKISLSMVSLMEKTVQKGFGREHDILEEIVKTMPDFSLIHASMVGNAPYTRNFQFFKKKVFKDSALLLALESDIPFNMRFETGAQKTDKIFKITKLSRNKKVVKAINNKPAFPELKRIMGWSEKTIEDVKWTDRAVRYPMVYEKNGKLILRPWLTVLGDYLGTTAKIEKNELFIENMTPEKILMATDGVLTGNNPIFGFFSACLSQRDYLGIKVFQVQEKLKQYFQEKPFLLLYVGGEGMYKPDEGLYYLTESLTSVIFHEGNVC